MREREPSKPSTRVPMVVPWEVVVPGPPISIQKTNAQGKANRNRSLAAMLRDDSLLTARAGNSVDHRQRSWSQMMDRRGLVKGGNLFLNYETVKMTETAWRIAHSIAWNGVGNGYIVQKVKRIKETRFGVIDDGKFAWQPWLTPPTILEYYEAWYMHQGHAFPRSNLTSAGEVHTSLSAEKPYDGNVFWPTVPDFGAKYFNDTFSTTFDREFGNSTMTESRMVREAILGSVYFFPADNHNLMVWYNTQFKTVARHNRMLPERMTGGNLAVCLESEVPEPPCPPKIERKDLAIAWQLDRGTRHQAGDLTGLPTQFDGCLNLTSPHTRRKDIKLGKQVPNPGLCASLSRQEDFKYQDWFKTR